jgi:hypothetical protein
MVQFLASNTFVTNPAKIQMVGCDRDRGRFRECGLSSSLAAQLLDQIAKPGDKIAIHQIDELRDHAAHKSEAFP